MVSANRPPHGYPIWGSRERGGSRSGTVVRVREVGRRKSSLPDSILSSGVLGTPRIAIRGVPCYLKSICHRSLLAGRAPRTSARWKTARSAVGLAAAGGRQCVAGNTASAVALIPSPDACNVVHMGQIADRVVMMSDLRGLANVLPCSFRGTQVAWELSALLER